MSGARLLTLGKSTAQFEQLLKLSNLLNSVMYHYDAYREYYPNYPFLPWMHGLEACEHFFGMARQINSDFNYFELLQLVPKISQYAKAVLGFGLVQLPSDTDITSTIKTSYKLASDLAKALDMNSTPNEKSLQLFILIEEQNLEVSTEIELTFKHTTNTIDNVFNFSNIENENINDQNYQQQIISTLNNTTRIFHHMASHIISHFTNNNNSEMRFIKQREKRWKENWKTMTANLANLQQNELLKQKCIDKVASEIMCIESANIT
ncbi:hypothetical protein RhiirC2_782575 [Rhizophagus irregularis]|uniref:Uncharacterized protein n=1 Tax=Rhizophagus irregularis TaxID=588596 RepID=A0A2N1N2T5_9GLOM|nr:hypothetical protein RhiirC2_782575 [Rhizophagus irregularis]